MHSEEACGRGVDVQQGLSPEFRCVPVRKISAGWVGCSILHLCPTAFPTRRLRPALPALTCLLPRQVQRKVAGALHIAPYFAPLSHADTMLLILYRPRQARGIGFLSTDGSLSVALASLSVLHLYIGAQNANHQATSSVYIV